MRKIIQTDGAAQAIGPYSQANEKNGQLFISGQVPVNPATGKIVEGGIKEQTEQVMKNIGAILKEAGYEYSDIIKCTCLLADMDNFADMNEVYGRFFPENPPARAAYGVVRLPLNAMIEIECIAIK
ncbi:MAG: RidA family protein [Bacteroidales bacterium]